MMNLELKKRFYRIMSALLSDPLNTQICYAGIIMAALFLAFVVSQIIIFHLFIITT